MVEGKEIEFVVGYISYYKGFTESTSQMVAAQESRIFLDFSVSYIPAIPANHKKDSY
jgi:hypothetical protein